MGVAAVVAGILALILMLIPAFVLAKVVGFALGLASLALGLRGRQRALEQGTPTRAHIAAAVLGGGATVLGLVLLVSCHLRSGDGAPNLGSQGEAKTAREQFRSQIRDTLPP